MGVTFRIDALQQWVTWNLTILGPLGPLRTNGSLVSTPPPHNATTRDAAPIGILPSGELGRRPGILPPA